jgi:hypothetical protein
MVGRCKRALIQRVIHDYPIGSIPTAALFNGYLCPVCDDLIVRPGSLIVPFSTAYFKHLARHSEGDLKAFVLERILADGE